MTTSLLHWLALTQAPCRQSQALRITVQTSPQIENLFQASSDELYQRGLSSAVIEFLQNPPWELLKQQQQILADYQVQLITFWDKNYPNLLKEIPDPPLALFVRGNIHLLATPQLAIVGSRHASHMGRESAIAFAKQLTHYGLTITSGLAIGIDGASHEGALANGGNTIAVMGSSIEQVYPKQHAALFKKILEQGCIVSEYPPNTPAHPGYFPQRNRIISGLSMGVLVVEAAARSGSLITARLAGEQGREVFALPGSIHNPLAKGCHLLLREGAKLVETAQDIVEELPPLLTLLNEPSAESRHFPTAIPLADDLKKLLQCIGYEATMMDKIITRSGLATETVEIKLLDLELSGYILPVPGGYILANGNR